MFRHAHIMLAAILSMCIVTFVCAYPPPGGGGGGGTPAADPAIVYVAMGGSGASLVVMNADGARRTTIFPTSGSFLFTSPSWSPDGRSMCFGLSGRFSDGILLKGLAALDVEIVNGNPVSRNFRMLVAIAPGESVSGTAWSPDGTTIAYLHNGVIYTIPASGGTPTLLYAGSDLTGLSIAWSPDGTRIAYGAGGWNSATLKVLEVASGNTFEVCSIADLASTNHIDWGRTGGNRIAFFAYAKSGSGKFVYTVDAVPGASPQLIASSSSWPTWSPDDSRLAYTTGNNDSIVIRNLQTGAVTSTGARGRQVNWRRF